MKITEIRERRAAAVAKGRALLAKAETENRQLTADESKEFDTIKAEITDLEGQEARAQFIDDAERRSVARPAEGGRDTLAGLEARVSLLDVVQAGIAGRPLSGAAAEYHAEAERRSGRKAQGMFVPLNLLEKRAPGDATNPNATTTAGDLVPTVHRGDLYVSPLRASLAVRALGVRVLSNLSGNLEIPKGLGGITSGWVSENEALSTSALSFDSISLSPKHVGAISSWSRQLAQQSDPSIESLLRDDLAYAIGAAVDAAIVAGAGAKDPRGIVNTTGVQTADVPATWQDVLAVEGLLADANVTGSLAWYTSPTILRGLRGTLKAATAGSEYIATASRIGELPASTSTAAPAGTAVLGDWSNVLLGTWSALDILVNPYESAAYARGNVLIRAMLTADVAIRHPEAFVVCTEAGGGS